MLETTSRQRLIAVTEALANVETALIALTTAGKAANRGLLPDHPACADLEELHKQLLVTRARLEQAQRRIP